MSITRRFLLAPSLARLIEKERGGHHVNEGYFPDGPDRSISVRIEQNMGMLILVTHGPHEPMVAPVELPRAHAEALLALAAGGVDYQRIDLNVAAHEAYVSRLTGPGVLDSIAVCFDREEQAREFEPLHWFGPEVTADQAYQTRSLALAGLPAVPEVELTDAALNSLLDVLESPSASHQRLVEPAAPAPPRHISEIEEDTGGLGIEDSAIRELARSLRPKHR